MTRAKISLTAAAIAHILAWASSIFFLFGPAYSTNTGDTATLIEVNGLWSAILLVIPVALTALALLATLPNPTRPRLMLIPRWTTSVLLLLFCTVSMLSIGIFYLPSALAMLVAAIARPTHAASN